MASGPAEKNDFMKNYLKYLIKEELYLVSEDADRAQSRAGKPAETNQVHQENLVNRIIVMIRTDGKDPYSESDQALLKKILQAVQADPEKVLLLDLAEPGPYSDLLANHHMTNCRIIGFLDSLPENVQNVFPRQKYMIRSSGGFDSLLADPLFHIENDRTKKKKLWEKLQDLFKLND